MSKPENVHGTGLVLGEVGVLLRGPSGAGKSVLALALLDRWEVRGQPAFLISDDRVDIIAGGDGLVMQAPPRLAGLIELRGRGIIRRPHRQECALRLVVDLVPDLIRMVEEEDLETELFGHRIARAPVPQDGVVSLGHQELLVVEALHASAKDGAA